MASDSRESFFFDLDHLVTVFIWSNPRGFESHPSQNIISFSPFFLSGQLVSSIADRM